MMYLKINLEGMREVEMMFSLNYSFTDPDTLADIAEFGWMGSSQMSKADLVESLSNRYELEFLGEIIQENPLYVFTGDDDEIQSVEYDWHTYIWPDDRDGICQVVNILPEGICEK